MTISWADVPMNIVASLSYAEVTNIVAEGEKKTKSIEGDVLVIDKRHTEVL